MMYSKVAKKKKHHLLFPSYSLTNERKVGSGGGSICQEFWKGRKTRQEKKRRFQPPCFFFQSWKAASSRITGILQVLEAVFTSICNAEKHRDRTEEGGDPRGTTMRRVEAHPSPVFLSFFLAGSLLCQPWDHHAIIVAVAHTRRQKRFDAERCDCPLAIRIVSRLR